MNKCVTCYYAGQGKFANSEHVPCYYACIEKTLRNCPIESCDKYISIDERPKDWNNDYGCASCKYYQIVELFDGICTKSNKLTWIYKPACKEYDPREVKYGRLEFAKKCKISYRTLVRLENEGVIVSKEDFDGTRYYTEDQLKKIIDRSDR